MEHLVLIIILGVAVMLVFAVRKFDKSGKGDCGHSGCCGSHETGHEHSHDDCCGSDKKKGT